MESRIDLLKNAGVISDEIASFVLSVEEELKRYYSPKKELIEMLITHLAMAHQRVSENMPVNELSQGVLNDLKKNEKYGEAETLYKTLCAGAPNVLPESEEQFVLLHLCNLLQED